MPAAGTAIRAARHGDIARLQAIERAAGEAFRALGMAAVADDEPPSDTELAAFVDAGRAWVAVGPGDGPLAYLIAAVVDGDAHVEQVSVDPASAGRRLGASLVDHLAGWSVERGLPALTLTTFAEVPWNAPYYTRLGFDVVPESRLGPGLRAVRSAEAAAGLDRWPRVAMRRPCGSRP
ncbi:hypothetical protein DSM112329_02755 [Paraconexibacter sp. AEG42_29]|uniref:N-acetyltransferase domain-containing protein n=1 Tax=Paraconexibacter sp. AEG42_29 TaxID=2997339 RepID=A0AAU7AWR9_9ACTN